MKLSKGIIETPIAMPGMRVGDVLRICYEKGVPGLPFAKADGRICGRFSVRHTFLVSSIPIDMIKGAHLIGHEALHLEHPAGHYQALFQRPIDDLIRADVASLSSDAQITKAMALMEMFNSAYLFIIDEGRYRGVVTRLSLTGVLLRATS